MLGKETVNPNAAASGEVVETTSEEGCPHPRDSKITQTLSHEFCFDESEGNHVFVREVTTDWAGAVFDSDSSRDSTGTQVKSNFLSIYSSW